MPSKSFSDLLDRILIRLHVLAASKSYMPRSLSFGAKKNWSTEIRRGLPFMRPHPFQTDSTDD